MLQVELLLAQLDEVEEVFVLVARFPSNGLLCGTGGLCMNRLLDCGLVEPPAEGAVNPAVWQVPLRHSTVKVGVVEEVPKGKGKVVISALAVNVVQPSSSGVRNWFRRVPGNAMQFYELKL